MEVTFRKAADRKHFPIWTATKGKTHIAGSILGCDPRHLPHDIVTLVVERELGMTDGFFATVEAGGTFRSMAKRRHADGKAAIARNRPGLRRAEHRVHTIWGDWLAGRDTPCNDALDVALEAWRAVQPGGELTLTWPTAIRRRSTRTRLSTAGGGRKAVRGTR
jgi:hypothetical protein